MSLVQPTLSPDQCRQRQVRLAKLLNDRSLDHAVFVTHENIQYLTGFRPHHLMRAAVCVDRDGHCTLAAPNQEPTDAAINDCVTFAAQWHSTLRQEQLHEAVTTLKRSVISLAQGRIGVEGSADGIMSHWLDASDGGLIDIDADVWRLRRCKDVDELTMIRKSISCTEAMYARAREIIEPGISELQMFSELHRSAVEVAGEPLTGFGNDFQCGSPGGPPRNRVAQADELYPLDLGPAYRGYYADNCRTICVGGKPTDEQLRAWDVIVGVLKVVRNEVRPGVSCRAIFSEAQAMLDTYKPGAFCHHPGHGFGLFPHEAPHLNPNWDDVFEVGDCFTAEPGLYTESLNAGIRLEENFLVTASGVERLTNFALEL